MSRAAALRSAAAAFFTLFALFGFTRIARADIPVPKYEQRCTDLAHLLTSEQRDDIERRLIAYEEGTGYQIAVLTVPSLDGEPLEDFSYRVAKAWQLGRKDKDDGVLITVAVDIRRARIEVGKGVEGDLTDLEADRIIVEKIAPFTKNGRNDWYHGLAAAIGAIELKISGKTFGPAPPDVPAGPTQRHGSSALSGILLGVAFFVIMMWLFFRSRGGGGGGGGPFIFFGGGGFGGGGFGGGGGGGGGWSPPSGGGGDFGGGGASDDV